MLRNIANNSIDNINNIILLITVIILKEPKFKFKKKNLNLY